MEQTRATSETLTVDNAPMTDVQFLYHEIEKLRSDLEKAETINKNAQEEIKKLQTYGLVTTGIIDELRKHMEFVQNTTRSKKIYNENRRVEDWYWGVMKNNQGVRDLYHHFLRDIQ